jgi:hypothetical protein
MGGLDGLAMKLASKGMLSLVRAQLWIHLQPAVKRQLSLSVTDSECIDNLLSVIYKKNIYYPSAPEVSVVGLIAAEKKQLILLRDLKNDRKG